MPLQQILPTWLAINNCNFTSPSGMVDPITGQPYYGGGLNLGDYFDLTEQEANNASFTTNGTLHSGRYRLVQVDTAATAANVVNGRIGYMSPNFTTNVNVVTDASHGDVGVHMVVFLNTITPGNYGFVQEGGLAMTLAGASISNVAPAIGQYLNAVTATGLVDSPVSASQTQGQATVGQALVVPAATTRLLTSLIWYPQQG
jgi:hypothetical protein